MVEYNEVARSELSSDCETSGATRPQCLPQTPMPLTLGSTIAWCGKKVGTCHVLKPSSGDLQECPTSIREPGRAPHVRINRRLFTLRKSGWATGDSPGEGERSCTSLMKLSHGNHVAPNHAAEKLVL